MKVGPRSDGEQARVEGGGDVIGSSAFEGAALSAHLSALVGRANKHFKAELKSPLTVTLGDEFQGICQTLGAGVEVILWLEHALRSDPLRNETGALGYQMRFVLHEGRVESPVNTRNAHGMLGPGLTQARALLSEHRDGAQRIRVALANKTLSAQLEDVFAVLDDLSSDFKAKDFALIEAMFEEVDSSLLGARFGRHRTSIDRRRKTLKVDACERLERVLLSLCSEWKHSS